MKTRVISGAVLVVLLALFLSLGGYVLGAALLIVSIIGYSELLNAFDVHDKGSKKLNILEIMGYCGIIIHYILVMVSGDYRLYILAIMLVFFAVMIAYVFSFPKYKASQAAYTVFSFIYAPVMLSFIYLLRIMENGQFLVWVPFIAWVCDTCAYFAGSTLGKHKMTPKLSPKKTVEGAIGGVIGSVVVGAVFGYIYSRYVTNDSSYIIAFMIITFIASIISQLGDLTASGIKRDHDIKDYGTFIPGHGGIMDRFDSVIFVSPMIYFLAVVLL